MITVLYAPSPQFAGKKKVPRPKASEPIHLDPESEAKMAELEKMTEPQVNEKLYTVLVSVKLTV